MRDFQVKKGVMGYIVTIGCQVAGFSNKEDLLKAITEYVNDPGATEKKYYKPTTLPEVDHRQYGVANSARSTTATQTLAYQLHNAYTEQTDDVNPSVDRAKLSEMPVLKTGDSPEPTDPIAHWNTGSNRIG
jgi:pyruvate-formate lyase